jgi:hypothetical protein
MHQKRAIEDSSIIDICRFNQYSFGEGQLKRSSLEFMLALLLVGMLMPTCRVQNAKVEPPTMTVSDDYPPARRAIDEANAIALLGDVNSDGMVDMLDISIIIDAFLSSLVTPNWNPCCDMNGDLSVDMMDISVAIDHFMESAPELTTSDYLWVDSFSSKDTSWGTVGVLPWLSDNENCITSTGADTNQSWFGFADSSSMPTQTFLEIQLETLSASYVRFHVNNSFTITDLGAYVVGPKQWVSINVSTHLDTVAKINGATLKFQSVNSTICAVTIYRARLHLFWTVPVTYGYTTNVAGGSCTLYCSWYSPTGLSTYKVEHNNTGSVTTVTGSLIGTQDWSNTTIVLDPTSLDNIWVRFSANDKNNRWSEAPNQTIRLVWSKYQNNFANFVGNSSSTGTRHGLGRNSFYATECQEYFVCYYNGTSYVASHSSDGQTWSGPQPIREGMGGGGMFYTYYEHTNNTDYFHYQYSNETLDQPLYYRKARILSNGAFSWLTDEQIAVPANADFRYAPNGTTIDDKGQTYILYEIGNSTLTWCSPNVTKTTLRDGTWVTASGYPKSVTFDTSTRGFEFYIYSMNNDTQVYIMLSGSPAEPARGRVLQNDIFGPLENLSSYGIAEQRQFSATAYQGNIFYAFTDINGVVRFCFRNFTTGTWTTKDFQIRQAAADARPVTQILTIENTLYVNWWEHNEECMLRVYNITSASWLDVERVWLCPTSYTVATENSMMPAALETAILHVTLARLNDDGREQWSYTYSVTDNRALKQIA